MNEDGTTSSNLQQRTHTLSRAPNSYQTLISEHCIHRVAFDQSVALGCFYDVITDCVLHRLSLGETPIGNRPQHESARCSVIKGDTLDSKNLFNKVGIHDEQWLNVMLNNAPAEGMASLIYYSFPKDRTIRFIYYYYSGEETVISTNEHVVRACIPKDIPNITATHVISTIKSGIQALVVLQLSSEDETNSDQVLESICEQLKKSKFEPTKNETSALERIVVAKVFSNIPTLNEMRSLADICHKITVKKPHGHCALEYSLRTIKWFYPSYPKEKAEYIPLDYSVLKIIKQYLIQLSFRMTGSEMPFESEVENPSEEYLQRRLLEVQQQIKETLQTDSVKQEQIRDLIIKVRSGTEQQNKIVEMLGDKSKKSFQNKVSPATKCCQALPEKEELTKNSNQGDVKSVPVLKKQSEHIGVPLDPPKSSKLATTTDASPVEKQPTYVQKHSSRISTAKSTPQTEEDINNDEELLSRSGSRKQSAAEITSPRKEQTFNVNEQHNSPMSTKLQTSGVSLPLKDQPKDNGIPLTLVISLKQTSAENASSQIRQRNLADKPTNISNMTTLTTPETCPQEERMHEDTEKLLRTSSQSSVTKNILSPQNGTKYTEEQHQLPRTTTTSTVRDASQTQKQNTNIRDVFNASTSSKPLNTASVSSTEEQYDPLRSSRVLNSESVQRTERDTIEIDESVGTERAREPLSSDGTLPPYKQPSFPDRPANSTGLWTHSTSKSTSPTIQIGPESTRSSTAKIINVLLLGESGVGKSTFINALVNYLTFDTFQEAHSSEPVVLMPVSFMMTVGDDFKEQIVKWGDEDCNEDHDHPGQSVTQHCRSYVVKLSNQTKIRIIDTPGMGDTRGLDQDDLNMQHILSFINNLSYLNAICILLKPNEARLNIVLRSCFTRLFNFLGENICSNIVFCFTNTRATFFAPGNTGPLLKRMINGLPIKGVAFEKRNTYCFDSESFRYLIALKNGIHFDDYQKEEYERSWVSSVKESTRLLRYICDQVESRSQNEWQTIEHAQSKISQIIRPMLEAIRNTLRNIILIKETSSQLLINLRPIVLSIPSTICSICKFKHNPQRYSEFWILPDDLHVAADNCTNCRCDRKKHIKADYKLEYEVHHRSNTEFFDELNSSLDQLKQTIFGLTPFYTYIVQTFEQTDPILPAFSRMIEEERQICSQLNADCMNPALLKELTNLRENYEKKWNASMLKKEPVNLANVYELIKNVSEIDSVTKQMSIIRQGQVRYMKQYEKETSMAFKEK